MNTTPVHHHPDVVGREVPRGHLDLVGGKGDRRGQEYQRGEQARAEFLHLEFLSHPPCRNGAPEEVS